MVAGGSVMVGEAVVSHGSMTLSVGGIEINNETLPLDLIEHIGPRGTYISEKHTLKHFRKFWAPSIFDRSVVKGENTKRCLDLLREKTINILETHQPNPLSEDLQKIFDSWSNLSEDQRKQIVEMVSSDN